MRDAVLTQRAKEMRMTMSDAETRLWLPLRAKRFEEVKFRRQKVIGPYITDFAARTPMLIIELDGDSHAGCETYDARRTEYLQDKNRDIRCCGLPTPM